MSSIGIHFGEENTRAAVFRNGKVELVHEASNTLLTENIQEDITKILQELKFKAENFLDVTVNNAVVSVPVSFELSKHEAIKNAGYKVGLKALSIINESTAVALNYGFNKSTEGVQNFFIFNLNANSFEVAIVSKHDDLLFEVKSVVSDTLEEHLVQYLIDEFKIQNKKDLSTSLNAIKLLRIKAKTVYFELLTTEETCIHIKNLFDDTDFILKVKNSKFEALREQLFEALLKTANKAFKHAAVCKENIHDIILVGDSTERMKKLQNELQSYFNGANLNWYTASVMNVLHGASILAAMFSGASSDRIQDMLWVDVADVQGIPQVVNSKPKNLIHLACRHNKPRILANLLVDENNFNLLDVDENDHNAFYYAMRSCNIKLLQILLEKWPSDCPNVDLNETLSQAYQALQLRNVPLTENLQFFIENKLIELRFVSDVTAVELSFDEESKDILKRIDLVCEEIDLMKGKVADKVFLSKAELTAKNIRILKGQLTANRVPWNEMEFYLTYFVAFMHKPNEMSYLGEDILNKQKILNYLKNFANILLKEKQFVAKRKAESKIRLKMENIMRQIIRSTPQFKDLFDDYEQIKIKLLNKRIDLICEKIEFLNDNYTNLKKVDEVFLLNAKFITQNVNMLKRELSYERLPWEELEFCLIQFIAAQTKRGEMSFLCTAILSKKKVLKYLLDFGNILIYEKKCLSTRKDDKKMLKKYSRADIVKKIKEKTPQFAELYDAFKKFRDIFSLNKILEYINLAIKANSEIIEGKFIITRALQFIGEHFKNTLESPKLSDTTSKLLLLAVPQHTRKIITSLRDSLSHVESLSKRTEIEENTDVNYFTDIKDDIRVIAGVIPDILFNCKLKIIQILCDKTIKSEDNDEIKNLLEMFNPRVQLDAIKDVDYVLKHNRLLKLIEEFKIIVLDKGNQTNSNKINKIELAAVNMSEIEEQFEYIEKIMVKLKTQTENIKKTYEKIINVFASYSWHFRDINITDSDIQKMRTLLNVQLPSITNEIRARESEEIHEISDIIAKIYKKIADNSGLTKLSLRILGVTYFRADDLKWIEDLYDDIQEKENIKKKAMPQNKLESQLEIRISYLQNFLNLHEILRGDRLPYKTKESCRAVIEMLLLDIMSLLDELNLLEHNPLYLVDSLPLLIGKNLRNHLAHHNAIVDIMLTDPWISLISNAVKLKSAVENKQKIGNILIDVNQERNYQRSLKIIKNQSGMFDALKNGDLNKFETKLRAGADISARNMHFMTALHNAAQADNLKMFKFLLNQKLDVNANDLKGRIPLHYAAAKGRTEIAELLIAMGAPVNDRDNEEKTALCFAAQHGHMDIAKMLIKNNADIMNRPRRFVSPTHLAIRNRQIEMAAFLLKETEFFNFKEKFFSQYLIHTAAENGCLELVNALLKNGANVNAKDAYGRTPLHVGAERNHLKIVNALIVKGASVDETDAACQTALHKAAFYGSEKVVQMLVKHGANVNCVMKVSKSTPLHFAASSQNEAFIKIVETLIENKADVNAEDIDGQTPLHCAAEHGHLQIAELLIKASKEAINCKDKVQITPLHFAAFNGDEEMCARLLEIKPDLIKAEACVGKTALYAAVGGGHESVVNFFIKQNASIDSRTKDGTTPLHFAIERGHVNIVDNLIRNGAKVNEEDKNFRSPLNLAVSLGNKDIVKKLIAKNANVEDVCEGDSLLCVAIGRDHLEIVKILLEAGADVNAENGEALLLAAQAGNSDMVKVLLENGAKITAKDEDGVTALHFAAVKGHRKIVETLIKAEADINAVNNSKATALHMAAALGQDSTIKELLKRKDIDINAKSCGLTALGLAVLNGHLSVVKLLLQHKKVDKNAEGKPVFYIAELGRSKQVLEYLIDEGIYDMDSFYAKGFKPMHDAALQGSIENIKFFLNRGFSINELDDKQRTLLHLAVQGGHLEVVKYLIEEGANVIAEDKDGNTAQNYVANNGTANDNEILKLFTSTERLLKAVQSQNATEVEKAISEGVLINANFDDETALHCAVKNGHEKIVNILLDHKANSNVYDSKKLTPLHFAAKNGNFRISKALLAHGAKYNALSDSGETPKDLTQISDIKELLEFIDLSFENVKENNDQFLEKLKRVKNEDLTMKAIMNAKNDEMKTLMVVAIQNKFGKVKLLRGIAMGYCALGKYIEAINCQKENKFEEEFNNITEAFEAIKNRLGPDNFGTLQIQCEVAIMHCAQGNNQKGFEILENVLTKQREILHLNDEDILDTLEAYGILLLKIGQYEKSLNILRGVHRKQEKVFGFKDSRILITFNNIAAALQEQKIYDEAQSLYEQIYESIKEQEIELRLRTQYNIAYALFVQKKYEESLKIWQEIYEKTKKDLNNVDYYLQSSHKICQIHLNSGYFDEALKILQEISKTLKQNPQNDGTIWSNQEYCQGFIMLAQQNLFKALAAFRKCFDNLEEKHPEACEVSQIVGNIFWELNLRRNDMAAQQENLQKDFLNAATKGDLETIQYCIKYGFDVNNKYDYGRTLLHLATENGKMEIVYFLLKKKADVTQATNKGNTTLHTAVNKGNEDIVRLLLQHVSLSKLNDFINAKTTVKSSTALHVAAKANNYEILKILLQNGANFNAKNRENQTAFELTKDESIKKLLKTIETHFKTIKNDKNAMLSQLKALEPSVCLAVMNARDKEGKTLTEIAETALQKELKKLQANHELNQLKKLKDFADEHIDSAKIKKLLKADVENLNRQKTLEIGVNYLKNAFNLIEIHQACVLSKSDHKSLATVSKMLKELEFEKKFIYLDCSTADFGEQAEGLAAEIKNTKFFKLLHTELNENISSFVQLVEDFIEEPIKQVLETVNKALAISSYNATEKQ